MSFLLDALRKSEGQKQAGRVPTIHDAESLAPAVGRKPGWRPWLLLAVVVALVAVSAWRYLAPRPVEVAPVSSVVSPQVTQPAGVEIELPAKPGSQASAEGGPGTDRTPVESFDDDPPAAAPEQMPEPAAVDPLAEDRSPPGGDSSRDYRTPTMSEISYWSLPVAVREEVPPMKITVLVYAERPGDRFVLVDGRRLQEGDTVAPGLLLLEIRREGAVFSYRHYRFIVSR